MALNLSLQGLSPAQSQPSIRDQFVLPVKVPIRSLPRSPSSTLRTARSSFGPGNCRYLPSSPQELMARGVRGPDTPPGPEH